MALIDELVDVKHAIRAELEKDNVEYKGYVFPFIETDLTGGLVVYADAIRNYGAIQGYDFSWIYDERGCADANYRLYQHLTDVSHMFSGNNVYHNLGESLDLYSFPKLNLNNVENFSFMFYTAPDSLFTGLNDTDIPYDKIDMSKAKDVARMFWTVNGFVKGYEKCVLTNLGAQPDLYGTDTLYDTLIPDTMFESIISNLYDRASAGYSVLTLNINNAREIPEELITIATNKGWIISSQ